MAVKLHIQGIDQVTKSLLSCESVKRLEFTVDLVKAGELNNAIGRFESVLHGFRHVEEIRFRFDTLTGGIVWNQTHVERETAERIRWQNLRASMDKYAAFLESSTGGGMRDTHHFCLRRKDWESVE